jgi:hypothetical protein
MREACRPQISGDRQGRGGARCAPALSRQRIVRRRPRRHHIVFSRSGHCGTMPRTARTMIANDRGPLDMPARYPARTFRSISARCSAGSADSRCAIRVGPVEKRHPACRRREAQSGSCMERENLAGDAKGRAQAAPTVRPKVPMRRRGADCPVVVMKRGNARGARGAGHRR